jgi:hypothetical protein
MSTRARKERCGESREGCGNNEEGYGESGKECGKSREGYGESFIYEGRRHDYDLLGVIGERSATTTSSARREGTAI